MTVRTLSVEVVRNHLGQLGPASSLLPAERLEALVGLARDLVGSARISDGPSGGLQVTAEASGGAGATALLATAWVVVPAFAKYERRAKTAEAAEELGKIYAGAAAYYEKPPAVPDGASDERLPDDVGGRTTETWRELNFKMNDAHYFSYDFAPGEPPTGAKVSVPAASAQDTGGTLSTFTQVGRGDPDATARDSNPEERPADKPEQSSKLD